MCWPTRKATSSACRACRRRADLDDIPALERLDVLVGTWELEGQIKAGPAGPAGRVSGLTTYEWLEGGFCLVQHAETIFGGASEGWDTDTLGDRNVTIQLWWYDDSGNTYRTQFFSNNGGPSGYEGELRDGTLTFTGPARFSVEPNDDRTVSMAWDPPGDNATWTPWMEYTMTKVD